MVPSRVKIKGLQGKDGYGRALVEPQEPYEELGGKPDVVDGNFVQDPFELKAAEEDHTPNFTEAPKQEKMNDWTFHKGRGSGGTGHAIE